MSEESTRAWEDILCSGAVSFNAASGMTGEDMSTLIEKAYSRPKRQDAGVDVMVLHLMICDGDGFAAALAQAWLRADDANSLRLMQAFGDLYQAHADHGPDTRTEENK